VSGPKSEVHGPAPAGHPPEGNALHPHDEDIRKIAVAGAWLGATVIVVSVLLFWLFGAFERREVERDPPAHPMLEHVSAPPEPRLQPVPTVDLRRVREEERKLLESHGWVDREAKIVRIPVERAAELLLQRGLPVREK
jgi:hypothetical protein